MKFFEFHQLDIRRLLGIANFLTGYQASRQDIAAVGAKNQKEGPKTRRGATFLKYSIGCMQQPVGQT